jgi:hypothetical protein
MTTTAAAGYHGEWLKTYVCYIICDFTLIHQDMSRLTNEIQYRAALQDRRYVLETDMRYHPMFIESIPGAIIHYMTRHNIDDPVSKWLLLFRSYVESAFLLSNQFPGHCGTDKRHLIQQYNRIYAHLSTYDSNAPGTHVYTRAFIHILHDFLNIIFKTTTTTR